MSEPTLLADHIDEQTRRRKKDRSAIAAVGWMADPISRSLGEENRLIDIGGHAAPAEVLAESTAAHKHNVVTVGVFFVPWAPATGAAAVVAHTDNGTLVECVERERIYIST